MNWPTASFAPGGTTEADVRSAIAETFAGDGSTAGSTGLLGLMKKSQPVVRWGDRGMTLRPIITYYVNAQSPRLGNEGRVRLFATFDIFVEGESTGLEDQIADRVQALMIHTNLNSTARTNPVDVSATMLSRAEAPELDEGRRRLRMEYELMWNR